MDTKITVAVQAAPSDTPGARVLRAYGLVSRPATSAELRAAALQATADLDRAHGAPDLNRIADSFANIAMDLRRMAKAKANGRTQ